MPKHRAPHLLLSGDGGAMRNYALALGNAGADPVVQYAPVAQPCYDALVLCGGGDLDAALFQQPNQGSNPPDPVRDRAELDLVAAFARAGKPILGICRGMQVINVALGGTLVQHLPPQLLPFHWSGQGDLIHPIRTQAQTLLHQLYGASMCVNSYHHQSVAVLGTDLLPCAWSEGGVVEGLYHRNLPILGVQFHPERMAFGRRRADAGDGALLLHHFVALCRGTQSP